MSAFFTRAARDPWVGLGLFTVNVLYTFVFTGVVQWTHESDVARGFHTALAVIQAVFILIYLVIGFITPIYDKVVDNDYNANFASLALALGSKVFSMSMIYQTMWLWNEHTFEAVNGSSVLDNWLYFIQLAFYLTAGTAGPCVIDTTSPFSGLISGFDIYFSKMFEYSVIGVIVGNFYHLIKARNEKRTPESVEKDESSDDEVVFGQGKSKPRFNMRARNKINEHP